MRAIAYTGRNSTYLTRLSAAFPEAVVVYMSFGDFERKRGTHDSSALLFDMDGSSSKDLARLAMLRARFPTLPVVAAVPPSRDLPLKTFSLAQAGVDEILLTGTEDHPTRLRQAFARAAEWSVARSMAWACAPVPPALTPPRTRTVVTSIAEVRSAADLASRLGQSIRELRTQLSSEGLFPPRVVLAYLRVLAAARRFSDSEQAVEQVALQVGYSSGTALDNACNHLLSVTPSDIRRKGGLAFAAGRVRRAASSCRRRLAS